MAGPRTEEASDRYRGIDTWRGVDILAAIAAAQREAIDAVAAAVPALAEAGEAIADAAAGRRPLRLCRRRLIRPAGARSTRSNCPGHMASPPTACRC